MEAHIYNLLTALKEQSEIQSCCAVFGESLFTQRLRNCDIPIKIFSRRGRFSVRLLGDLVGYVRHGRFDGVHCHGYVGMVYGLLAAALARVPLRIVTIHSDVRRPGRGLTLFSQGSFLLAKLLGAYFIAVSDDLRQQVIQKLGLSSRKIFRVHNGIAVDAFHGEEQPAALRQQLGASSADTVVSIIGRLGEEKGHEYFLHAARQLLDKDEQFFFLILGDGPLESKIKALVRDLRIAHRVRFLGFIQDVKPYLCATDVCVIASLHEGIPYALLEAMSLGRPIVSTQTGGLVEVLRDGHEAIMVPVKSAVHIRDAVLRLAGDKELAKQLGLAARRRQEASFSSSIMAEQTAAVYRGLYKGPSFARSGDMHPHGLEFGDYPPILTNHPGHQKSPTWARLTRACTLDGKIPHGGILDAFLKAWCLFRKRSRHEVVVLGGGAQVDLWYLVLQRLWPFVRRPVVKIDALWYKSDGFRHWAKRILFKWTDKVVDRYVVWSRHEVMDYSKAFGLPPEKFVFSPYHTTVDLTRVSIGHGEYLFSGGNFARDYKTLAHAVRDVGVKVILACSNKRALAGIEFPSNVTVVSVDHEEFMQLMAGSWINVVCLAGGLLHSGGQQTFLNAMVMGKPVIVTDPVGASDYIRHGVDGLLVHPGHPGELGRAIHTLLNDPALAVRIGHAARVKAAEWDTENHLSNVAHLALELASTDPRVGFRH